MNLIWESFQNIKQITSLEMQIKNKSAIYVWGWFDTDQKFVPYYVGKARNLATRLFEHIGCLKGGLYSIYSFDYITRPDFVPCFEQDGKNLIYIPSTIENWNNVFRSTQVQEQLNLLLAALQFTWCITDNTKNKELEKIIYHKLFQKTKKVGATVRGKAEELTEELIFSGNEVMTGFCS